MRLITVNLPVKVIEKIEEDIKGTSITNVENFIENLVNQKYPELQESVYTAEEEEIIRERLRKLGYIE